MSHSKVTLPPYPVQIGSVKRCSPEKHLQEYVQCGDYAKVEKILKKGIFPDSTNSQGQTPLFVAALLGLRKIVDLLLNFGSRPNHRCLDWSTPVHAAAFSCDQWIMSRLIDAGGDLRLYDQKSRRPYDWARMAGEDQSALMIDFIDCCTARMQTFVHFYPLKPMKIDSSQGLINRSSLLDLLSPRKANKSILKGSKFETQSVKRTYSFGYGQFCVRDNGQAVFLSTLPFIEEKSLVREERKPTFSYAAGPYMTMTNLLWGSTEVTVKGLGDVADNKCLADLLIAEEENMRYLQHPLILLLLALSTSPSLDRKQLVFERVTFGSFYNILHERRLEYPILHLGTIVHILLQMIEALVFLHWRGFIHRSFSSHAIQIFSAGRAKLSNFEYMLESNDNKKCDGIFHFPIPKQLYRWSSPEVVAGKVGTIKSDLYSFCTVMQESLTDTLPWNGVDGKGVKDSMVSGLYLTVDPTLSEPYYSIVSTGIQARPEERTTDLQDIGFLLKYDVKHLLDKVPCAYHAPLMVEAGGDMKEQCSEHQILPDTFEEITDLGYKGTSISSCSSSKAVSSMESQSETLCNVVEKDDETNAHLLSLEKKTLNMAENFYQQNVDSLSVSLSLISDSETGTSSDSEQEDIDCRSLETNENWQAELQTLDNRLNSIQIRNKVTLDNLLYIQRFLTEHRVVRDAEEGHKEAENVCVKENECPHRGTDDVDYVLPLFKSKSYAGWSAKGPPLRYRPPEGATYSKSDIPSDSRRIQSESVIDTMKRTSKKGEKFTDSDSFKAKAVEQFSTGQDFLQSTKRCFKRSQADDIMRPQYYPNPGPNSALQCPTKNTGRGPQLPPFLNPCSQHLKKKKEGEDICDNDEEMQTKQVEKSSKTHCGDGEETKLEKLFFHFAGRKYQSQETEDYAEIPVGVRPDQDKETDDSNLSTETSYFTPEIDVSSEKTEQETLNVCDASDHSFREWSPGPSSNLCFDKTLTWTPEALENHEPGLTTIGSPTHTRSTIDVEELSSISCDQKNSQLQFTTPRNTEASARHSTPVSPGTQSSGAISKRRSFRENQLRSPNTTNERSLASPNKNVSSKTSECFLSAMCDLTDYDSAHQEETFTIKDQNANIASVKNRKSGSNNDALPEPQGLLNKTDCQCQSMEITCLINETICGHPESGQRF